MEKFLNDADWASVLVSFLTLVVAAVAVAVALRQITTSTKSANHANALQSHREYLNLCFSNPEYSSYNRFTSEFGIDAVNGLITEDSIEHSKYNWFLSVMLATCEQILNYAPNDREWRNTIHSQIEYHEGTLAVVWSVWKSHYDPALCEIVDAVLSSSRRDDVGSKAPKGSLSV